MDDVESEYDLSFTQLDGAAQVPDKGIRRAVIAALRRHHVGVARLSFALVNDARIAQLNKTHLARTGPTDVLAFNFGNGDDQHGDAATVDGEIVLSLETASREAARRGHTEEAEAALYAVHGTLHLLGYDDHGPDDAALMHSREDEILESVGLGRVYRRRPRRPDNRKQHLDSPPARSRGLGGLNS